MQSDIELLVSEVTASFWQLDQQAEEFSQVLMKSTGAVWLPKRELPEHQANIARQAIAKQMCRIWFDGPGDSIADVKDNADDLDITSGLVVADATLVAAAEKFNQAKTRFGDAIKGLKDQLGREDKRNIAGVHHIEAALAQRDPKFSEALGNMGLGRLDLIACYKLIRILEDNVRSVSWTWARSNSVAKELTKQAVWALVEKEIEGNSKDKMLKQLATLPDSTLFAQKKKVNQPQLRANITFVDGAKAKQIQTPGVCLIKARLPKFIKWPGGEAQGRDRVTRTDAVIDTKPVFETGLLNIFLYKGEGKKAKARKAGKIHGGDQ